MRDGQHNTAKICTTVHQTLASWCCIHFAQHIQGPLYLLHIPKFCCRQIRPCQHLNTFCTVQHELLTWAAQADTIMTTPVAAQVVKLNT